MIVSMKHKTAGRKSGMLRSFVFVYARMTICELIWMTRWFHDVFFIMKVQVKRTFGNLGTADDIVNCGFGEAFGQKTLIRGI